MDKLIRKILTVVLVLAMVGCSRHYYVKEFPVSGKAKVEKAPKIVYLGFRTYQSRITGSASRRTTYTAELVYETRTIPKLKNGVFINQLKSSGFRGDIPSDKVQAFAMEYLGAVKSSGALEISTLVDVEKKGGDVKIFKLRNFPVDYYVIGVHGPAFRKNTNFGISVVEVFSSLFSMVTLGLIPVYSSDLAKTEVKIYDKNLKLVNSLEYDNSYSTIDAIWVSPNPPHCKMLECTEQIGSPPSIVYSEMGPKIEEDVLNSIQKPAAPAN